MSLSNVYNLPLGLSIQKGLVQNYTGVSKFGLNTAVGTSFETIWDGNNTYTYPSSAGTATATSSDTGSDNTGTVEIQGLDSNYDLATETLTIGGSAGSTSFIRVFRAVLKTANTGTSNVGVITITVSSTTVAQIRAGYGQSLMCVYTVPRKHNAYLMQLDVGSSKHHQWKTLPIGFLNLGWIPSRRLFHHHVGVGATEAKGGNTHPPWGIGFFPRHTFLGHLHRQFIPGNVFVEFFGVKRFGNLSILKR